MSMRSFTIAGFKLILLLLAGLISACQPAVTPSPPPPTVTPTATATSTPTPRPSPTPINLSALETFTHAAQGFSIDYPIGWQVFEQTNGVIILAPDGRFGYTVVFTDVAKTYSDADMSEYVASFVAQNFAGDSANFKAISYRRQDDGVTVARFSTVDPKLGPTIGQLNVRQQGTIIYAVYLNAPENEWPAVESALESLAATLRLPKAAPIEATPTPPVWVLTGPVRKEFGFLVASNWATVAQDDNSITVSSPEKDMQFTASNFPWPGALSNPNAAGEAALAHLAELKKSYPDLQHLPPAEFPLDTATGATIDFVYTPKGGQPVAGSVITAVGNGKMHKIVFTAPAELYDLALEWFNPMLKSFKFLSPAAGLNENEK